MQHAQDSCLIPQATLCRKISLQKVKAPVGHSCLDYTSYTRNGTGTVKVGQRKHPQQ
jgi:hypothetical protein